MAAGLRICLWCSVVTSLDFSPFRSGPGCSTWRTRRIRRCGKAFFADWSSRRSSPSCPPRRWPPTRSVRLESSSYLGCFVHTARSNWKFHPDWASVDVIEECDRKECRLVGNTYNLLLGWRGRRKDLGDIKQVVMEVRMREKARCPKSRQVLQKGKYEAKQNIWRWRDSNLGALASLADTDHYTTTTAHLLILWLR